MMVKRFLSATDNIIGVTIYDARQEKVGTIKDVFIDPDKNEPIFVTIAEGGFLGIGSDYVALPWHILEFNTNSGSILLESNIQKVKDAPEVDLEKLRGADREEMEKFMTYYGYRDMQNTEDVDQENYQAEEPSESEYQHQGYEGAAKITDEAPKDTDDSIADKVNYEKMKGTK